MKQFKLSVSHHDCLIEELRRDPEFATIYLNDAFATLGEPEERAVSLLAIRNVAEAYGGLKKIAGEAGISRESLYRALSPKGNPTLNTLLAVLKSLGMRLAAEPLKVEPETREAALTA